MPNIVGIKFNNSGKIYFFGPKDIEFKVGDGVIVETVRGQEYAFVAQKNTFVKDEELKNPLKDVIRKADKKDEKQYQENIQRGERAVKICEEKVEKHGLKMKLINAEYTFDRSKVVINFTADGRVDFRELVKDLASELRTRIELHQVYEKDDVILRGAMGMCGQECCCIRCPGVCDKSTIKMAKNQNISLNPANVGGICGKLMCCLRFENDFYQETLKKLPKVNSTVKTEDGMARVLAVDVLRERIEAQVQIDDSIVDKFYHIGEFEMKGAQPDIPEEGSDDDSDELVSKD